MDVDCSSMLRTLEEIPSLVVSDWHTILSIAMETLTEIDQDKKMHVIKSRCYEGIKKSLPVIYRKQILNGRITDCEPFHL